MIKLKVLFNKFHSKQKVEIKTGVGRTMKMRANKLKLKDIIFLFNKFEKAKFVFVKNENGNLNIDKNKESITGTLEDIYYDKDIDAPNMYVKHVSFLNYYDVLSQEDNQYLTFFLEDKNEKIEKNKKEK
jgi:hypothetical protein